MKVSRAKKGRSASLAKNGCPVMTAIVIETAPADMGALLSTKMPLAYQRDIDQESSGQIALRQKQAFFSRQLLSGSKFVGFRREIGEGRREWASLAWQS